MHNVEDTVVITNCTFTGNLANQSGAIFSNNSSLSLTNCILWGDTPDEIGGGTITYCDVQGGTGQPWFGTGCIDTDPLFMDADGHLSVGSPCIDAGINSAVPEWLETDLDGNPRIVNDIVDMGAFEAGSVEALADMVINLNLQSGIENSLDTKLDSALKAIDDLNENNDVAAINSLQAFINAVEAQRGKKITNEQADELIAAAQQIINRLTAE